MLRQNLLSKFIATFLVCFVLPLFLWAQQPAQPKTTTTTTTTTTTAPKKQSLEFEDELIEGAAQKPDFFYLFQKKNNNFKKLIKLRENFLPEMRRSGEEIQKMRGGK